LFKMTRRNFPHFVAARAPGTAQPKDAANLFRGEAKLPCPSNEPKGAGMLFAIDAVPSWRSRRGGYRSYALEVADGFDVDAGLAG